MSSIRHVFIAPRGLFNNAVNYGRGAWILTHSELVSSISHRISQYVWAFTFVLTFSAVQGG